MADIFLSYARADLTRAELLATALEQQGWSVFWDSALLAGQDFHDQIEDEIGKAGCMIVAWSEASRKSQWVKGEATLGHRRKILVPILLDAVDPPINFLSLHTENFVSWNGKTDSHTFIQLKRAVERLLSVERGQNTADLIKPSRELLQPTEPLKSSSDHRMVKLSLPRHLVDKYKHLLRPLEPEMVVIPAGSFQMGSNEYEDEKPVHIVTFAKPFALSKYPVTFSEYDYFAEQTGAAKPHDEGWGRGRRPVINVSWEDASAYARWLVETTHKRYRLPSEAEWEYAARAGSAGDYFWGDAHATEYAWFSENSGGKSLPVDDARIKANQFGLYHMAGNVCEWLEDLWHESYNNAPNNGSAWIHQNAGSEYGRVLRGGSWYSGRDTLSSAERNWLVPASCTNDLGFRLAQDLP
ncbi:SUMF1/EgtB/PvdO family nonheme iron enzyme [Methylomonas rosea]|uniref:SUMF1/EgtB/PvdO family nonheme iron enzyme n=1 Tax=Methylomonas rosea TaxID=2952227 RepID=A0ABT1TUU0_9GAMM|nr:SUMF1/EgtB/PvdO family nonheme iron enzyme [Methylomonas sp. WSC-7]MCQ8118343.1 SUMF1/EgtB/PvdO family nonheme iron enzyme [Methylomonas sp. WSC-7]